MNLQEDPVAILSSACRLPLGITSPSQLWDAFCNYGDSKAVFTSANSVPDSRRSDFRDFINPTRVGGAGWLGKEGVESFDPDFFNITPAEAEVLRPNTRLALELTWEALERAGIPPISLRGKNVSVSIGAGTEDGWDMRRFSDDKFEAFDHRWAANSDPSGISGRVAHFFDFRGPSSVISTACSSGAFALRDGIQALLYEECELAIVGAVTTHFFTAPFDWAASVNVASKKGQCAAFSREADGYVPSEGAVFFVLKRGSVARESGSPVLGIIRSLSTGHNGATRALATPNVGAQATLTHRSLRAAGVSPSDVTILEAHGTGTRLGDALEAEAFRSVYDSEEQRNSPLWVSSSKTLFGHCQAASMLVGILKVLACFEHKALPPHLVDPPPEFKKGQIQIPTSLIPLQGAAPLIAQVCSFGFTGSIASLIIEEAPHHPTSLHDVVVDSTNVQPCFLPFSAKTTSALDAQIAAVYAWACKTQCSLYDLGALLSLGREHHPIRISIVASSINNLREASVQNADPARCADMPDIDISHFPSANALLNLHQLAGSAFEEDRRAVSDLIDKSQIVRAVCLLYNKGHKLCFDEVYDLRKVTRLCQLLRTFPTYAFDRKLCWKSVPSVFRRAIPTPLPHASIQGPDSAPSPIPQPPTIGFVAETVASVLHIPVQDVPHDSNIFDLGIDSLNSIELAGTLSQTTGIFLPVLDLYSLLTVQAIFEFFMEKSHDRLRPTAPSQRRFCQADVDAWVAKYGAPLDSTLAPMFKRERPVSAITVLLTGANGMLGCHLLHELLSKPAVAQIFCPVRGDAWTRISSAYSHHGHDTAQLIRERETGRLVVFHTSDLENEFLGCEPDIYRELVRNVDTIVHLAWKLDFNLPAHAFQNCIEGTRSLAQLCAVSEKWVAYYFISSFSAYFGYEGALIPEQPLTANLSACLDQGYAVSKLIAEHALFSMLRNSDAAFILKVVRIGQICGNSVTGDWALNEMMPMMIKSLPALRAFPRNMPDVSWIPSDICAAGIMDFVLSPAADSVQQVLHLANPHIIPWSLVAERLAKLAGLDTISLVQLREYVEAIRSSTSRSELPIARLLPYFTGVIAKGDLPTKFCSLEVKESLTYSPTLAACPSINADFLRPIIKSLLKTNLSSFNVTPSIQSLEPPVLLFGPWSESTSSSGVMREKVEDRVHVMASKIRREIQYDRENKPLDYQLATLANQVSAFEELRGRSVIPCAVLGYCFGEYAASVCAGILSLETAVDIIVRRAAALRDVKGSMLNVFAELNTVKRQLLKLPFSLEIAIHAGPKHYIISGPPAHITTVQSSFQNAGIKTKLVETSIPFHSALMDHTIATLQLPAVGRNVGSCVYVSGLTGNAIGGERLGPKYWLRHMRDPVLFVDAVRYVQKQFPSNPLVDLGPGHMLSSIISRYKWDGCRIFTLEKFLSGNFSRATIPETHVIRPTRQSGSTLELVAPPPSSTTAATMAEAKMDRSKAESAIADILVSDFGFKDSESRGLLSKSFLMLGLQSLDFISFSEKVLAATGLALPASSFASDLTLFEILTSLTA